MKIVLLGLWHLGSVTAACAAKHFQVAGLDFDAANIAKLNSGHAPLLEPGLDELIAAGLAAKKLSFTSNAKTACENADILWLCYDTPVNDHDESDVETVLGNLRRALAYLPNGALVLISAQLPVGTCAKLEKEFPQFHFACSPENLRLGKAIDSFEKAERVIVGIRDDAKKLLLEKLFAPFTPQIIFMRTESAEMVKHALNSFLALSITFINEVARLCEHTGADAKEVSIGLKSEPRIGPKAYLGPGGPFAGGTLARRRDFDEARGNERRKDFRHPGHQAKQRFTPPLGVPAVAIAPRRFARQKNHRAWPDLHDEHRHAPPQRRRRALPTTFRRRRKRQRI
jgi:UDPglucose 6-dehydrogenase